MCRGISFKLIWRPLKLFWRQPATLRHAGAGPADPAPGPEHAALAPRGPPNALRRKILNHLHLTPTYVHDFSQIHPNLASQRVISPRNQNITQSFIFIYYSIIYII